MKYSRYIIVYFLLSQLCLLIIQRVHGQVSLNQLSPIVTKCDNTAHFNQSTIDTVAIANVRLCDSVLLYLVKEAILTEKKCPNYDSSTVAILLRVMGVTDSLGERNGEYCIRISFWDIGSLLCLRPVWYFNFDEYYGLVYGIQPVLDSVALFRETGESKSFMFDKTAAEKNIFEDDSHPYYEYWLLNHRWYYGLSIYCE